MEKASGKRRKKPILLTALGGNALIKHGQRGTIEQQLANLKTPARQLARLAGKYRLIITHGNGPQVGNLLLQQNACGDVPSLPLEILVAQTQGQIGYMIESTLDSELMATGIHENQRLVSLISYVVVDENDPAFEKPSKPIGPAYTAEKAALLEYPVIETAKGFRRVVASPQPVTIVEKREIRKLIEMDFIVICCGGGGIPVIREGRAFQGVDAVIDKDLASAKLAEEVGADFFVIATDVPGVFLDFKKESRRIVRSMTVGEAIRHAENGQFLSGSMGPKIEACIRFVQLGGGRKALIAPIEEIEKTLAGRAGTEIVPQVP